MSNVSFCLSVLLCPMFVFVFSEVLCPMFVFVLVSLYVQCLFLF